MNAIEKYKKIPLASRLLSIDAKTSFDIVCKIMLNFTDARISRFES